MMELCPRCDAVLPLDEGSVAAFCAHCGLPQLRVSAELSADNVNADAATAGDTAPAAATAIDWPALLRVCALTCVADVVLCFLLPGAFTTAAGASIALFSLPLVALATAALYTWRHPSRRMDAGIGARMGAVIALFVTGGINVISAISGFVLRYRYHAPAVEQAVNLQMQQLEAQVRAINTAGSADPLLASLRTPEWHAGMFLWIQLIAALLVLAGGSLFGALAGALLGARQRRNQAAE